jgi:hypothetical protein
MVLFASTSAHAIVWTWNYVDGSAADGQALPVNSLPLDQAQYKAESITVYPGLAGQIPGAGATFSGYTFFRLTDMSLGGKAVPFGDGTFTYGITHEITGVIFYTGHHTDPQNFVFDSGTVRVFFDAGANCTPGVNCPPTGTAGFTISDFADLTTFTDGVEVEIGKALGIGGVIANPAVVANGSSDFVFAMTDLLSQISDCGASGTEPCGYNPWELTEGQDIIAVTDNDNKVCGTAGATCFSTFEAIRLAGNTLFGNNIANNPADLQEFLQNDGSLEKISAVPLPASLLLMGVGLSAVGILARRSRRSIG